MNTRKKITLAVANGCKNTRQVASFLDIPLGTANGYFYKTNNGTICFANGEFLQWDRGKGNTLQLGPRPAITRGPDGKIKDVGMVADMDDLKASISTREIKCLKL